LARSRAITEIGGVPEAHDGPIIRIQRQASIGGKPDRFEEQRPFKNRSGTAPRGPKARAWL
jgi:hypothetical protein